MVQYHHHQHHLLKHLDRSNSTRMMHLPWKIHVDDLMAYQFVLAEVNDLARRRPHRLPRHQWGCGGEEDDPNAVNCPWYYSRPNEVVMEVDSFSGIVQYSP